MDYHDDLQIRVSICTACGACYKRKNPISGDGKFGSPIMVVYDMPNVTDDKKGKLLSSRRGKNIEKMLRLGRLRTENLYYTTVLKCYPGRAKPDDKFINYPRKCKAFLREQINIGKPLAVILIGLTALRWALIEGTSEKADKIDKWSGKILRRDDLFNGVNFLSLEDPYELKGRAGRARRAELIKSIHTLRKYVVAQLDGSPRPVIDVCKLKPIINKHYTDQELFGGMNV